MDISSLRNLCVCMQRNRINRIKKKFLMKRSELVESRERGVPGEKIAETVV